MNALIFIIAAATILALLGCIIELRGRLRIMQHEIMRTRIVHSQKASDLLSQRSTLEGQIHKLETRLKLYDRQRDAKGRFSKSLPPQADLVG